MSDAETAIRARRKLTNKLIATHEAARLRPFLHPGVNLIAGDGALMMGVEAVLAAFDAQFRDPDFVTYVRAPQTVEIDSTGDRAAERGTWEGRWRGPANETVMSGVYLAVWRKITGQWVIESELYVTLS